MIRVLVVAAALMVAGAAVSLPAIAQPASAKGERVVESRVVSVRGDQVFLHDGTTLKIPPYVANPLEIEEGDTVRFTYETKNGQNIATSIQFRDRPSNGMRRRF